jgi:hypothetical protein
MLVRLGCTSSALKRGVFFAELLSGFHGEGEMAALVEHEAEDGTSDVGGAPVVDEDVEGFQAPEINRTLF